MYTIFNRISWIIAILTFSIFFAIDEDLFFAGIVFGFLVKFLLNKNFINNNLGYFKENLTNEILEKLKNLGVNITEKIEKDILKKDKINIDEKKSENVVVQKSNDDFYDEKFYDKINQSKIIDSIETKSEEKEIKNSEPSKIVEFLSEFFAENLMAKLGGILLALGVIFLMSLVYTYVGPITKIIIGFALGFSIYFAGIVINKKGFETEGMILLGTGILINYIVILSGKFIIGESVDGSDGILGNSITFTLLILNTLFSVITSFVYNSKNLLLFSIIFAYVTPFLLGLDFDSYLLVGYSLIVTLGGFAISNYLNKNGDKDTSLQILFTSLVGGNILFLFSPFDNSIDFVIKMIGYNIINFTSIYLLYKNKFEKNLLASFIVSYIFLGMIMFSGYALTGFGVLLVFVIATLGLLLVNSFFVVASIGMGLLYLLFLPLIFVLGFLFLGASGSGIILIPLFLLSYLFIFTLGIGNIVGNIFKYLFFSFLGIFLIIGNIHLSLDFGIDIYSFSSMFVTSFVFLFSTYFLSNKKDLNYLYTVGTIATIFILAPIVKITGEFSEFSILAIFIFGTTNYLLPFINKNLVEKGTQNLVLGLISGVIFVGINLARYGMEYFPGVSLGYAFLILAIIYFLGGFNFFNKLGVNLEKNDNLNEENKNVVYTLLGVAISLFSISIALIFSSMPAIITMVWLFQATILFYFANKFTSIKIYLAGIVLFIIGLIKFLEITFTSNYDNGLNILINDLVPIGFIVTSLLINVTIFKNTLLKSIYSVNLLHTIGMFLVFINLVLIFDFKDIGGFYVFTSIFLLILTLIYNLINNKYLNNTLFIFVTLSFLGHIVSTELFDNYNLNYLFTIITLALLGINNLSKNNSKTDLFNIVYGIYFFVITSIYLYHITNNNFALTIYWGILSIVGINTGIGLKNQKFRSLGLFVLGLTLIKIVFYDVWNSIDNGIIRVIAFMFVGGIMIYISSLYKNNNLKVGDDFIFKSDDNENKKINNEIIKNTNTEYRVNKDLESIDIGDLKSVVFKFNSGKKISIRAKNLIKISKLVISESGKNVFEKNELKKVYDMIIKNYKSELSKRDYDRVVEVVENFVKEGGSVDFN